MKTFVIKTLGCKVNQYESQQIRESFQDIGFKEASNGEPADICIINTCTVTARADYKSRQLIRQLSRKFPKSRIVVTGCYTEKDAEQLSAMLEVDFIVKNSNKSHIPETILPASPLATRHSPLAKTTGISRFNGHNRAFLKVQDGCSNFCSYCKVPLVRGRSKSRPIEEVIDEAKRLVNAGFKEIVPCGICLGDYKWADRTGNKTIDLAGLLSKLQNLEGLGRIRLSSIEPPYVTERLIERLTSSEKFCRHLHIPLQSGDDKILKAMNRNYTKGQFIKLTDFIRKNIKDIAITTDVMVGFPCETEEGFNNTLKTIQKIKPSRTHIFAFSRRQGTKAYCLPGEVDQADKKKRIERLKELAQVTSLAYKKGFINKTLDVLVENTTDEKTGLFCGYTDNYIKVLFPSAEKFINQIVRVKILDVHNDVTYGKLNEHISYTA